MILFSISLFILFASFGYVNVNAVAYSTDDKIKEIAKSMNVSPDDIERDIKGIQERNPDFSKEMIIDKLYVEVVLESKMTTGNLFGSTSIGGNMISPLNSSGIVYDDTKLPSNQSAGRHFYIPSKTALWNHGHSGIYISAGQIIHAPGEGKVVEVSYAKFLSAPRGTKVVSVSNASAQWGAVNWAQSKKGSKYNNSVDNMMCDRGSFNCSQLVYCAFKSQGISLSNGSWWFVTPLDVVNDSDVKMTTWSR